MTRAPLERGNGVDYPWIELSPKNELTRVYKRLIEYQRFIKEGTLEGSFIDRTLFKDLHSALFFDLKDQINDMIDGSHKLKFSYTLDGVPSAYVWKAVVLYERQITSDPISGSVKLAFKENNLREQKKAQQQKLTN